MTVINIENILDLHTLLNEAQTLILVDCYATWCGPCKRIAPQLEKLQEKFNQEGKNVKICKMDIEKSADIREWVYNVNVVSVPTFFILRERKVLEKIEGANINKIEEAILKHL